MAKMLNKRILANSVLIKLKYRGKRRWLTARVTELEFYSIVGVWLLNHCYRRHIYAKLIKNWPNLSKPKLWSPPPTSPLFHEMRSKLKNTQSSYEYTSFWTQNQSLSHHKNQNFQHPRHLKHHGSLHSSNKQQKEARN